MLACCGAEVCSLQRWWQLLDVSCDTVPWSLPLSMGIAAPPWGHGLLFYGVLVWHHVQRCMAISFPRHFPVPSLSPYAGASSTVSWGTSVCFALLFVPKHLR